MILGLCELLLERDDLGGDGAGLGLDAVDRVVFDVVLRRRVHEIEFKQILYSKGFE